MATIAQYRAVLKGQVDVGGMSRWASCDGRFFDDACRCQGYVWRDRFWTPLQTFWTFLWQVLHVDSSCREAVAAALTERAAGGMCSLPSGDPTAYCQARKRLPLVALQSCVHQVGRHLRDEVGAAVT
jgi:hypothetical protein